METGTSDIIVVLGCSLRYRDVLRDRVAKAAELWQSGAAPKLLLSGGPNNKEQLPEAHVMKEIALELGVPEQQILLEDRSLDTLANARYSAPILRAQGVHAAHLVTSTYHTYRAGIIFRSIIPGVRFDLSPCADRFSPAELERRNRKEEQLLTELAEMGIGIPPR